MAEYQQPAGSARVEFGLAVIDKPAGITSNAALSRVRRVSKNKRAGHTGTLDPFATGVLVVAVGRATRLFPLLHAENKRYSAILRLGASTDTADLTGEVVALAPVPDFSANDLVAVSKAMRGPQLQIPPAYSAKKVAGVPSHVLARQGRAVELGAVEIEVFSLALARTDDIGSDCIAIDVECSRGTYVRTLAEEVAHRLGTLGHLIALRRTLSDGFGIEAAVALDGFSPASFLPLEVVLQGFDIAFITEAVLGRARHGHEIPQEDLLGGPVQGDRPVAVFLASAASAGLGATNLIGIYRVGPSGRLVAEMLFVA